VTCRLLETATCADLSSKTCPSRQTTLRDQWTNADVAMRYDTASCPVDDFNLSAAASRVHAQPGLPAPPNHWLRLNPYMLEDSPHHSHAQGLAGHIGVKTHSCSVTVLQHTTVALAVGGAVPPSAPDDPAAVAFEPCCSVPAPRVNPLGLR
jgi:hypothetical protein